LPIRPDIDRADRLRVKLIDLKEKGPSYLVDWAKNRIAWEFEKRRGSEETASEGQQFHNLAIQDAFLESVEALGHWPCSGRHSSLNGKWASALSAKIAIISIMTMIGRNGLPILKFMKYPVTTILWYWSPMLGCWQPV